MGHDIDMSANERSADPEVTADQGAWSPQEHTRPERVGVLVKQAQAVLHQRMDEKLRPLGLSIPQYACMHALLEAPGISAAELARRAFVSRQSMNVMLQGLERRGLVERPSVPSARRERVATLTKEAEVLVERARAEVAEVTDAMTSGLSAADAERLEALLITCRDALLAE